jgi:N-hydroxyarylamine O-acetyltransferase
VVGVHAPRTHIIRNGAAELTHLADRKALRTLIAQHFGFALPELETMKVDAVPDWQ